MLKQYNSITVFFLSVVMYISCTDSINNSNNKSILIKYDSLEIYNPFNVKLEKKQKANPFTIIAYINVSCASCLEEISKWNDFYSKINKNKTDIIMICYSKDNFEYFRYLCETNKIENTNNIFYLDNYKVFEENNSILRLRHTDQTVLLDSNNNILLGGNPFHSAEVKANYFSILKNTSK